MAVFYHIRNNTTPLYLLFLLLCLSGSCRNDDLPDTLFEPIGTPLPDDSDSNNPGLLVGTWYLKTLFEEDGTEKTLSDCHRKRNATYYANGTCRHAVFTPTDDGCTLTNSYTCRYSFELGIITSSSTEYGTVKSIVKFFNANTLEVFNNLGNKIAVYRRQL